MKRGKLLLIIIIIIIIIGGLLSLNIIKNKKIKNINIKTLKYFKCLSGCPYEITKSGDQILGECKAIFCRANYPLPNIHSDDYMKYKDKIIIHQFDCMFGTTRKTMVRSCIIDFLQKYSHIIDLSNLEIEYPQNLR
jgi:hypothetical protein